MSFARRQRIQNEFVSSDARGLAGAGESSGHGMQNRAWAVCWWGFGPRLCETTGGHGGAAENFLSTAGRGTG